MAAASVAQLVTAVCALQLKLRQNRPLGDITREAFEAASSLRSKKKGSAGGREGAEKLGGEEEDVDSGMRTVDQLASAARDFEQGADSGMRALGKGSGQQRAGREESGRTLPSLLEAMGCEAAGSGSSSDRGGSVSVLTVHAAKVLTLAAPFFFFFFFSLF
ncbi:hypothetical protein T492DRAFT_109183 [Pavlovales sp. CCMP2436]|nr:hypothetical protein T492DRAFT_109183 [Pavlovales sp. CCMP2436]